MAVAHLDARYNPLTAWLLEQGANPNHVSHDDWTPLMLASWGRIVDSAPFSVLIKAPNLDVNVQTPAYGWTALMMAVRRQRPAAGLIHH